MSHLFVLSDVHLCEGTTGSDLWMKWRSRAHFPDSDFSDLVTELLTKVGSERAEIVFNGDLFDFDAGRVMDGKACEEDLPRTEEVAVELLGRILDDHRGYVAALARWLGAGHRVVFVSGNHDPQLVYPRVQDLLRARLLEAVGSQRAAKNIVFCTWFYRSEQGIHLEHGHQYDSYCSFRYPSTPHSEVTREIQPTLGSVTFRHLISRMGYFNPHVDATWNLGLGGYMAHWFEHYMPTKRSLTARWFLGAIRSVSQLVARRDPGSPARETEHLERVARETGTARDKVAKHAELFSPPAEDSLPAVIRELWLDRATLAGISAISLAAPFVMGRALGLPLALGLPALFAAYEALTPKPSMDDIYKRIDKTAHRIAEIHGARAVIFGHTHVPFGRWDRGVFYGNSGTWSAAFRDQECTVPVDASGRPVIWLRGDGRKLSGGLYRFLGGELKPDRRPANEIVGAANLGQEAALAT